MTAPRLPRSGAAQIAQLSILALSLSADGS